MIINYNITAIDNIKIWPLDEVKNYLRISYEYDDQLIVNLISAAIDAAESFTGLSLHVKHVVCVVSNIVGNLYLKYIPVLQINKMSLLSKKEKRDIKNDFGYIQKNNSSLYFKDKYLGKNIEIKYEAGYRDIIPRAIQYGILLHVASMYENSEDGITLSSQIKDLYNPYRVVKL